MGTSFNCRIRTSLLAFSMLGGCGVSVKEGVVSGNDVAPLLVVVMAVVFALTICCGCARNEAIGERSYRIARNRFILGVLFPHSIFPDRAPPQHALLTVFIGGDLHPQRANLPLEELLPLVENDLQHLLGLTGSPRHTSLHRWPNAIPQYTLDIPAIHQQLNHIETHHPGIHFAGTYRHGISISNALTSGETIAQRIIQSPRKEYGTTST